MSRVLSVLVASALLLAAMPQAAQADAGLHAVVGRRAIPLRAVSRYHCHDLDLPTIRCFREALTRDRQVGRRLQEDGASTAARTAALLAYYVTFYEHANYGGASYTTSTSLTNLGNIGWNDIVSSFKSLNGSRPRWWEDAGYVGISFVWSAGANVSYVGATANDRFSSVKNDP